MCNRNAASQSPKFEFIYYFRFQNSEYFSVNNEKKMKCMQKSKRETEKMERERKTKRPRTRKYDTIINIFCHYFVQNGVCVCVYECILVGRQGAHWMEIETNRVTMTKSHTNPLPCVWLLFSCNNCVTCLLLIIILLLLLLFHV